MDLPDRIGRWTTHHALENMSATPLIALQAFQVAFLWLHDWVPLGRLNDVAAARRQDPLQRLVKITLLQSVPWTQGLIFSLQFQWPHYPAWLRQWLWISYGILFAGELRAWWYPYLIHADAGRATRYRT